MYLGFSSNELDQNQITDYLTRVVQPQADRRSAACSGPTSWAAAPSPCASGSSPSKMAALGISPSDVRDALRAEQLPLRARQHQGLDGRRSTWSPTPTCARPRSSSSSSSSRQDGASSAWATIADVVLGAENYDQDVRFNGQTATFMGIWVLPTANSLDVIKRVRAAMPDIQAQLPAGMKVGHPVRLDRVHPGRDRRGAEDPDRDAAHRHHRHLPVPGLVPLGADPGRRDPDLARSAPCS